MGRPSPVDWLTQPPGRRITLRSWLLGGVLGAALTIQMGSAPSLAQIGPLPRQASTRSVPSSEWDRTPLRSVASASDDPIVVGRLSEELVAAFLAAKGDWPAGWSFLEAALVASGVEDRQELAAWKEEYARSCEKIIAEALERPPADRAGVLHELLHARLLTGRYDRSASDLRRVLREGKYNCLSSVALFWVIGVAGGLKLEIWTRPGHAYLKLHTEQGVVEFDPGRPPGEGLNRYGSRSREFPNASCRLSEEGLASAGLGPAHPLIPRQFLGRFYYNRAVERLQAGQYHEALSLLRVSLALDPADADARQNYLAGINNWAVSRWRQGEVERAVQLIRQGLQIDPTYAPLRVNQRLLEARQ